MVPTSTPPPPVAAVPAPSATTGFLKDNRWMRWAIPAAIVEFEAAMILGSENMEMHFDLADAYVQTDQVDEVVATLERAIVSAPDEAWVQESAGWFYQGLEHHEEAIRQFERALELDPGAEWVFEGMAISYEALGNFDKADEIRGMIGSGEQGMDPYA